MEKDTAEGLKDAIRVDTAELRGQVDAVVRSSVEETLNALLQAEADQICRAGRYERSSERVDTRAGHYERKLETKVGAVVLKMPKLRSLPFETAIIERYRRREASVEEALVEMYLAGVSVRRVEDITEALWGTRVSSGTVSRLNQKDLPPYRGLAQPQDSRVSSREGNSRARNTRTASGRQPSISKGPGTIARQHGQQLAP